MPVAECALSKTVLPLATRAGAVAVRASRTRDLRRRREARPHVPR